MTRIPRTRLVLYSLILAGLLAIAGVTWASRVAAGIEGQRVTAATVQITTIATPPDFEKPWQRKATATTTGSGAIIDGNRILTNAHNVAHAVSIEVRRPGVQKRFPARVEHVDHTSDLALLAVDDPAFFAGVSPLEIGALPAVESSVRAYGYPIGGEAVSATAGVVSRVEADTYVHSQRWLLVAQIDAALNPGNSGGPVVSGGKIVAIAMQALTDAENIGYAIPAPVIRRFLVDAEDGTIAGVPGLGLHAVPMESDALREYHGLSDAQTGALVIEVGYGGSAWGRILEGDVILAVDGVKVANDETISLSKGVRTHFAHQIQMKQVGEAVTFTVWRDRREQRVTLTLGRLDEMISLPAYAERVRYRVAGGVVFQPASIEFLLSLDDIPSNLYHPAVTSAYQSDTRRELVVMTGVLPHAVNRGYQDWALDIVETVQGVPVRDFEQFNELVDGATGRWIDLTFDDKSRLVMDLAAVRKAHGEILEKFSIAADRWPARAENDVAGR